MKSPSTPIVSKLARLVPVLLLIVAVAAAPAWGGMEKRAAKQEQATSCCHSQTADPNQPTDDDGDCCGKNCRGCMCPCAKLVLISGLRLAPTMASSASVLAQVLLSALSLSNADPIFHPPRV
jgi:hypothetical protein